MHLFTGLSTVVQWYSGTVGQRTCNTLLCKGITPTPHSIIPFLARVLDRGPLARDLPGVPRKIGRVVTRKIGGVTRKVVAHAAVLEVALERLVLDGLFCDVKGGDGGLERLVPRARLLRRFESQQKRVF